MPLFSVIINYQCFKLVSTDKISIIRSLISLCKRDFQIQSVVIQQILAIAELRLDKEL